MIKVKRTIYKEFSFVDYEGHERPVTMCAASLEPDSDEQLWITKYDSIGSIYDEEGVSKILSLGVAVGHINDQEKWSSVLGRKIAYQKATNLKITSPLLITNRKGFISTELVNALLEREEAQFKQDPGLYIPGYNEQKKNYKKKLEKKLELERLEKLPEVVKNLDFTKISLEDKKIIGKICQKITKQ